MFGISTKTSLSIRYIKDLIRKGLRHENIMLIIALIALVGGVSVLSKGLTTSRVNIMNVLLQSSIRGVASIGQAFVILTAGIDVSVGGVGLVSSILGASLMTQTPDLNIVGSPISMHLAILIMLLVGATLGTANGLLVSRLGMPPLIVTLGMWEITKGLAFRISGGSSLLALPENLAFFGAGTISEVPVPFIIFVCVSAVAYLILEYTKFGRSVYAVGGNPISAWLSGLGVKNITLMVYIISGFLAGLAGIVFTSRVMSATMRSLVGLELDTIAAVCVGGVSLSGGRGRLIGVFIGVLIIGVINNAMSVLQAGPAMQSIVKGAIIFAAVAVDHIRRR